MIARLALAVVFTVALAAGSALAQPGAPARLAGDLLVASPEMRDPRFAGAVIYVTHHDAAGAQGFIVNRPVGDVALALLLQELGLSGKGVEGTLRVHAGGPVERHRISVLHTADYAGPGTTAVKNGVSLTVQPDILRAIAEGKGPRRLRLLLGYAGWAPGQLEAEMEAGAWIRAAADESLLFDDDYNGKWERARSRQKLDL